MTLKAQYTPNQCLEALVRHDGSRVKAAAELELPIRTFLKKIKICRDRGETIPESKYNKQTDADMVAAVQPAHDSAPEGYLVRGVSTLFDGEGNIQSQWHKTVVDDERRMQLMRAAVEELASNIRPQEAVPYWPVAEGEGEKLCNLFTITDYHVGMLAWRHEGGADWDLEIAESTLMKTFSHLVANAPSAKTAIVAQMGDFLHFDGLEAVTPTSQHNLDTDSRFQKIVQVAVRVLRVIINMALTRHERVHVIMAEGNHDIASSVWLRILFKALFENESRITIDTSPLPYYAYRHGKTMLTFHHGHLKKATAIHGVIPAQFPEMWGQTKFRFCHMGHLHHRYEKEDNGIVVVQHPTLAARDAHSARHGWWANRAAKAITYHEEFGEVGSNYVTPEMVQ